MALPLNVHHDEQPSNWIGSGFNNSSSSPIYADEPELPSSFVMDDGTDWDSHIGSIFGNQMPRKSSSIDFGLTDYQQHNEASGFGCNTVSSSLPCSPHQDHITLQDVIDADEQELLLQDAQEPWRSDSRSRGDTAYPQLRTHLGQSGMSNHRSGRLQRDFSEGFDVVETADPCYARLLWKCLREAPAYTLSLKDIYAWIRQHTQKARDPKNKGWQNSVRHNLSMNAAFERVASGNAGGEGKKGSLWRLTENAVESGVISTTRYRRDPKRKPERRGQPAPKRQISGAKGGAATRAASQFKRLQESREARERFSRPMPSHIHRHYTTTPESSSATPMPAHMMHGFQQALPPSPYFVNRTATSPTIMESPALSSPYTPPTMQMAGDYAEKGCLRSFELSHLDYNTGLFNNIDIHRPYTPSMLTESSFYTDDAAYMQSSDSMMPF